MVLRYSLAALVCALAIPAAAHGATLVSGNGPAITIVDSAKNGLGTLNVAGASGDILDLDVTVNLTHQDPDDVDLALVSPDGDAQILMSDVCGAPDISGVALTFDQDSLSNIPDNGPCPNGLRARPTDVAANGDEWTAPGAPAANFGSANLDSFDAENPNGAWRLFTSDDAGGGAGVISSWSLTITTGDSEVVVPADSAIIGPSKPYPSAKSFELDGLAITDLDLRITGFHHQRPDDVDMLLQAPSGQAVMVMSDACGTAPFRPGFNWLFSDEANLQMTDETGNGCTANLLKPSAFGEVEDLPPPAPPGPYATSLSAFDDLGGSSNWRLYVNDDTTGESGYIESWEIVTTTRPAAATGFASATGSTAEGQTAQLAVTRAAPAAGPATIDVAVTDGDTNARDFGGPLPTKLQFARGETSKTIDVPIAADLDGEEAEVFYVALGNPVDDAVLSDATAFASVTIAKSAPDNRFTVGDVVRKRNGSATVEVKIPSPGTLETDEARGKNLLNETEKFVQKAGTTKVKLKPATKAKRKLNGGQKVKLTAEITYTPDGGSPNQEEAKVTLRKK